MISTAAARLSEWSSEVVGYWRECATLRDFGKLMRVRLSQSKIGPWVTPEPIIVRVNLKTMGPAVTLRSHTTDISVLKELLFGGTYEWLPPDPTIQTVVDLGANVGLSHRWLRARYPQARFVCVEPDPGNLAVLEANVRAVDAEAVIHAACVGGRERRVTMATTSGEWGFRMSDDGDVDTGGIDVITMEQLIADADLDRVDVLKCDIEGAEAEVFADCAPWIGRVGSMSVECHTDVINSNALMQALSDNGVSFDVRHLEVNPEFGTEIITLQRR